MTVSLFAILFNLTAIGAVLAASVFLQRRYGGAFFALWTRAYAFGAAVLLLEVAGAHGGRPLWLVLEEAIAIFGCTWFYLQTALSLLAIPQALPRRLFLPGAALWVAYAGLMAGLGVPFNLISAPPVLCLTAAICAMGVTLIRLRRPAPRFEPKWVGWPVVAMGLWPLSFPLLEHTRIFWAGGWVAGVLHLVVGFGMALFLLDESEATIRRQNEELRQLDRLKGQFLATVSHELRTPLMSLTGYVELLSDGFAGPLAADQREYLDQIEGAAAQLAALVESLLDTAQAESGMLRVKREEVDLAEVLARVTASLAVIAARRGNRIETRLAPDLPVVWADAERVVQILTNLIGNSLKFADADTEVLVEARVAGPLVKLVVSDHGPGIPLEAVETIFQPFYQVDNSSTRTHGGTGLGLAIARSLATAMNGELLAHSVPGQGTSFLLALPVAEAPSARRERVSP